MAQSKRIAALTLLVLLVSCSPQRRLYRLVNNHPELRTDSTVVDLDTVVSTKPVSIDTSFKAPTIWPAKSEPARVVVVQKGPVKAQISFGSDSIIGVKVDYTGDSIPVHLRKSVPTITPARPKGWVSRYLESATSGETIVFTLLIVLGFLLYRGASGRNS